VKYSFGGLMFVLTTAYFLLAGRNSRVR
jgi:hypothetical protein